MNKSINEWLTLCAEFKWFNLVINTFDHNTKFNGQKWELWWI